MVLLRSSSSSKLGSLEMHARCRTTSMPANALARLCVSRMSPSIRRRFGWSARPSRPKNMMSYTVTRWPFAKSCGTITDPTYPAPPVTNTFVIVSSHAMSAGAERGLRPSVGGVDLVARGQRVAAKHRDGLERVVVEIFAHQRELGQNVVGRRDDVAADFVGLKDVEQLAWARPQELGLGPRGESLAGRAHDGHRIDPGVRHP